MSEADHSNREPNPRPGVRRRRVVISYHFFAHYRAAVLTELCRNGRHSYVLAGDREPIDKTIVAWQAPEDIPFINLPCRRYGRVLMQWGQIRLAFRRDIDTLMILGSAWLPCSWPTAIFGRLMGKRVIFWTHGWTRPERGMRRFIRATYYRLAHALMFYGHYAKMIAISQGFDASRLHVIYNSLDFDAQVAAAQSITHADLESTRRDLFGSDTTPVVICTSRLVSLRRLDLLIRAVAILNSRGHAVNLLLVGAGPERASLEELAQSVEAPVHFFGPCYEEATLCRLVMASNATVVPTKLGLTAMTSLGFGTPVITHGDPEDQGPEWEAVIPGSNGSFYRKGDVEDLANAIEKWTRRPWLDESVRSKSRRIIERFYNAAFQRRAIERAVDGLPADDLFWMKDNVTPVALSSQTRTQEVPL